MSAAPDSPGPDLRADPHASKALRALSVALGETDAPTRIAAHEVWDLHISDALTALEVPELAAARRLADIGSGAGVPGLVLAAALPGCAVSLVETVRRKAEWIAGAAERCGISNATAVWARAEDWDEGMGRCDVVTARAVALLPVLCEYAAPLLAPDGVLVCWKGQVEDAEAADGRAAAAQLGLSEPEVLRVKPYKGSRHRTLWVFRLVGEVPDRYPRRAGMALKRPLHA